uniref:Acyltransf_C domain-containing protein n=1 Tax=Panagrellus redivivus TaxID=6233 RepID=A0A7E4W1C5_PANRE
MEEVQPTFVLFSPYAFQNNEKIEFAAKNGPLLFATISVLCMIIFGLNARDNAWLMFLPHFVIYNLVYIFGCKCNKKTFLLTQIIITYLMQGWTRAGKTVWLMDVMFRWTPFGIIGQMHGDYFIQQGKSTRDAELLRLREHLQNVFWERDRRWVILFPEGGFYYKRIDSSQKYGREHGFPHLEHVTLPRMGAVKTVLTEVGPRSDAAEELLRSKAASKIQLLKDTVGAIREKKYVKETRPPIKYVIDVTIAYMNGQPLSLGTLIFGSREKCDIAVNYKVYKADEVPFNDDIALRDWMYKAFEEKDKILDNFYEFGEFNRGETGQRIAFPWSKIIGQYLFWFSSFYVQIKIYCWIVSSIYYFIFPTYA